MDTVTLEKLGAWLKTGQVKKVPFDVLAFPMSLSTNEDVQKLVKGCIDTDVVLEKASTVPVPDIQTLISYSNMLDPAKADNIQSSQQRRNYLMCVRIRDLNPMKLKIAHHVKLAVATSMVTAFELAGLDTKIILQKKQKQKRTAENDQDAPLKKRVPKALPDSSRSTCTMDNMCNRILELENVVYKLTEKIESMHELFSTHFGHGDSSSTDKKVDMEMVDLGLMDIFTDELADEIAAGLNTEAF